MPFMHHQALIQVSQIMPLKITIAAYRLPGTPELDLDVGGMQTTWLIQHYLS